MASDGTRAEAYRGHTQGKPGRSDAWSSLGRDGARSERVSQDPFTDPSGIVWPAVQVIETMDETSGWDAGVGSLSRNSKATPRLRVRRKPRRATATTTDNDH